MIGIRDLAVVEVVAIVGEIWFEWIEGAVRVVQVQPEKKRTGTTSLPAFGQPAKRTSDAGLGFAINQSWVLLQKGLGGECIIVKIEAARQATHSIQHIRAHDRAGRIPIFLESLRDRAELRIERLSSEILNYVLKRISAGEDCGVRRPRQRHLRNCAVKDYSVMRERVESWSLTIGVSVAAEMVGADRVDGDQNYVVRRLAN